MKTMKTMEQAQIYKWLNDFLATYLECKQTLNAQTWYVYLLRCQDNSVYTGVTKDVERRFAEHQLQGKKCAKCLRGKGPLVLELCIRMANKENAYQIERLIKSLPKNKKEQLLHLSQDGYK